MSALAPWVWLFPLPLLLLNVLKLPKTAGQFSFVGPLAIFAVAVGFLLGDRTPAHVVVADWIPFLPDTAFRLTVDGLSAVMLAVVGGVATCVFIYAISYMHDDERAHRFFAFLDFFVLAMCLLVVAGNLTVLLIGWTGVGIASFLLISFWWQKGWPLQAGFLALGANAIGDAALLLAAVLMPAGGGALDTLATTAPNATGGATAVGICLLIAAAAKSAQGPLWFWLPSAMAGPTPVSALIHAATMVAAGVYLLVRASPMLALTPEVQTAIIFTGLSTAILGGLASLWQTNFKRGIAYSTASQLGWMFVAVGLGNPFAAFFHLITHASFKAMLFLSAGTVIHAAHHEEDIRHVGGLSKYLKLTHVFFTIGALALIGTPMLSGSFSKDAILETALHSTTHGWVFYVLMAGAVLTGAYTGRLWFGIFHGAEGKASHHAKDHAGHLNGFDLPLLPLAAGAVGLGYLEAGTHGLSNMLGAAVSNVPEVHVAPTALGLGAFALGAVGFGLGILLAKRPQKGLPVPGGETSASLVGELQVLPQGIAAIHGGSVGRYLAFTVVGTALIAGLALRTTGALPNRVEDGMSITPTVTLTGEKATKKGGKRDTKDRGANGDKSDKKRLDPARLLAPGARDALRKRLNVPTAPAPEGNTP
jgi:NADH-quinone oxidoreductase subunit L